MTTKHTTYPWHVGMKPGPIIYGPNGEQVADLRGEMLPPNETAGNIKLITASPDMLEALKGALRYMLEYCREDAPTSGSKPLPWDVSDDAPVYGGTVTEQIIAIRAAIIKAGD